MFSKGIKRDRWQEMGQKRLITLHEKCPNTEFFLVRIQSKCGKIQTRKNSVFGHFLGSDYENE